MKTLIVAFDGLDYELIKEFGLESIRQEEFGKIDNTTGMKKRMTSELFASFITGENYEVHGAEGLQYYKGPGKPILEFIEKYKLHEKIRGFHRLKMGIEAITGTRRVRYSKDDLKVETIFDKISDSRAMFVPGYNPDPLWKAHCESKLIEEGYSEEKILQTLDERIQKFREEKLFDELESDIIGARNLLMVHFHHPDTLQDFHKEEPVKGVYRNKLLREYKEIDQLAGKIKEKALEQGYERVIFMSDHGRPEGSQHNQNAFYSCNKELFGKETPKITEFATSIL